MNFHLENQIVEIVIPFTDLLDNPVEPTDIYATLYDGEDTPLLVFGSVVFDPADVEAKVIVTGLYNTLQGDDMQEVRRLEVKITHPGGVFTRSHSYAIEAEQSIQIMRNSFMTYDTAVMTGQSLVNMTTFNGETKERQCAALVEAYRRITGMAMIYSILDIDGKLIDERSIRSANWNLIDADVFKTQFPSRFKRALRAAQVAEANDLLQGNIIAQKHAQGVASETIGESSVTLRAGFSTASNTALGAMSLAHLRGFLDRTVRIGRA